LPTRAKLANENRLARRGAGRIKEPSLGYVPGASLGAITEAESSGMIEKKQSRRIWKEIRHVLLLECGSSADGLPLSEPEAGFRPTIARGLSQQAD
jgi:hypothetical protein